MNIWGENLINVGNSLNLCYYLRIDRLIKLLYFVFMFIISTNRL